MTSRFGLSLAALAAAQAMLWVPSAWGQTAGQTTYPTEQAAVTGFVMAIKGGPKTLEPVLGSGSEAILSSGDTIADQAERTRFLTRYSEKHALVPDGTNQYTLNVGKGAWPLPIPLVKAANGTWYWSGVEGKEEVLYRRIGHNELGAISACRGVASAQKEYAASGHDGNPKGRYATRIVSQAGKQDGLYWPAADGAKQSPLGPGLAAAAGEGYDISGARTPYHGYYYQMLPNGKGFGMVAYPSEYRASGVMTFQVSQTGVLYQKDLGPDTDTAAQAMKAYAVDSSWTVVK